MIMPIRAVFITLCSFAMLSGLGFAALVLGYSSKFGDCVKLPNGGELSYEAFIDFGNSFLRPDVVLRDPEGVIIGKEIWPIHVTNTATFGTAWPEHDSPRADFSFVWTASMGLVKQEENPLMYSEFRITANATPDYVRAPVELHVNTLWMFKRLSKDAQYIGKSCATRLFTF